MASIDKVATGWRARWRTPDGQSRSRTFSRKSDAERHLVTTQHSVLTGSYVDPRAGRITFKAYAEQWRASQVHRPKTADAVERRLRIGAYPHIGDRPIGAIRPSEIQGMIKVLSTDYSAGYVGNIFTWTRAVFKAAVSDGIISRSPCEGIKRPPVDKSKVTPLAPKIVEQLIRGIPHRYQALIIFGAATGVRIGEAIGVTTDRIDWLRRTVLIDRQLTGVKDGLPAFGPVKDQKNRPRTIPLGDVVIGALADHVRKFGTGPEGLVFTSAKGGPVWQPSFSRIWSPVAGPLGIPAGDGFHQLRHFYASTLIRAGESVKVVQERLGHASAAMTLDVYSHLWPEDEERTRSAVDRVLGDLVSPPCHPEEAVD